MYIYIYIYIYIYDTLFNTKNPKSHQAILDYNFTTLQK